MLLQLVELLCEEMALAFKERGVPVPPWRKPSSLISKWKPASSSSSYTLASASKA